MPEALKFSSGRGNSFYEAISSNKDNLFSWKSIWRTKAPLKAAFFLWTNSLGNILTIDNLRKRGLITIDWCCMCNKNGEPVDHLLLHCEFAPCGMMSLVELGYA